MATSGIDATLASQVSLHALTRVQSDLAVTQKRISTGRHVADALDNGAIFAIAQTVLNQQAGVTAVNSQLNGAQGLLSVAGAALGAVSDLMTQARDILTRLADQSISSDTRAQLSTQFTSIVQTIGNALGTASYQGTNLLNTSGSVGVVQDVLANQLTLQGQLSTVGAVVANLGSPQATSATSAGTFLLNTFMTELNLVATSLNTIGSESQNLHVQVQYNTAVSGALTQGLGALVDANLPAESARLASQQVRHQLAGQSLAITNQSSSVLLSLFH
jgi:flagellin